MPDNLNFLDLLPIDSNEENEVVEQNAFLDLIDDDSEETPTTESNVMDSESDDGSSGSRETSWLMGEEGWIPDEFQPGVNRPDIQVDAKTLDPVGEMQRQSKMTQKDVLIDVYGTTDETEIEQIKYKKSPIGKFMTEHNKKHEETKKRLIDMYGTSDPEEIIALEVTNEDGSINEPTLRTFVGIESRDDKTLLNRDNLPTWEDKDIMDYIYAPYMKDAQQYQVSFLILLVALLGRQVEQSMLHLRMKDKKMYFTIGSLVVTQIEAL